MSASREVAVLGNIVVVVVGCLALLCLAAAFALVFRPSDFRRHAIPNRRPRRRPDGDRTAVPQAPEATLPSYTAAVIARQWPPAPQTSDDAPAPPVDAS
jgi:hypothetical protein